VRASGCGSPQDIRSHPALESTYFKRSAIGKPTDKSKLKMLPEIILFGDSLTAWSFDEQTSGFGLALLEAYEGVVTVKNEGKSLITISGRTYVVLTSFRVSGVSVAT
jgi:hypothetical protein